MNGTEQRHNRRLVRTYDKAKMEAGKVYDYHGKLMLKNEDGSIQNAMKSRQLPDGSFERVRMSKKERLALRKLRAQLAAEAKEKEAETSSPS